MLVYALKISAMCAYFARCALLWFHERRQKLFFSLTEILPFEFEYNANFDNI